MKLEIEWSLFLAQLLTFMVGMFLIWKLFLVPLLELLARRRDEISGNLSTAEKAREETAALRDEVKKELAKIRDEARQEISKALSEGEARRNEILGKASQDAEALVAKARQSMEDEKERVINDLRSEIGQIAVTVAEKILGEKPSAQADEKLIDDLLETLPSRGNR